MNEFKIGDYVIPIDKGDTDFIKSEFIDGFVIREISSDYARPKKNRATGIHISKIRLAKPYEIPNKYRLTIKEQKDKLLNMIREI